MRPLIEANQIPSSAVFIDARFRHGGGTSAKDLFLQEHIAGAKYIDLETQLSGKKTCLNGRHPLPTRTDLAKVFSELGIDENTHVVAYDDTDHAGAARLWMLLRWMGHEKVQVLNGGLNAWKKAGLPVESGDFSSASNKKFIPREPLVNFVSKENLSGFLLVDARAPERYRGEQEPLDPRAGHIPGAKNLFYKSLLDHDLKFLPEAELRKLFVFENPVFYCGSGVTAAVLLLTSMHLGTSASLYPGSWSEWCSSPDAEVETGP